MEIIDEVEQGGGGGAVAAITSGTIDGAIIGGSTAAAGTFTTLSADSIADLDSIALFDSNDSNSLTITWDENDDTNRTLKLKVSTGNRVLTMTGDATIADWFDQGVKVADSPEFAGVTLNNTGLHLLDTNASHDLIIKPGSDLTADKTLTLTTGDADRTITLNGNPTLNDWFDQGVKVADSPEFAAITENNGVLKQNLITNSGFGVWSNSLLSQGRTVGQQSNSYDVGAAILDNDGTAIGSWNGTTTRCTVTVGAGIFTITDDGTGSTMETSVDLSGLTIGKLYKFAVSLNNGTGTWAVGVGAGLQVEPNGGGANIAYVASQTEAGSQEYSVIWEATETNNRITLVADVTASQTVTYDNIYVIEVTPGCVAANALAMEGWFKKSGVQVLRQHNDGGTLTKDGSFYSLKVDSITAGDNVIWPLSAIKTSEYHYQNFAGRTVTFGAWVYATTASHAFLQLVDSDTTDDDQSSDSSSYHTGGSSWEWLEVTMTVSASTTEFSVALCFDNTTTAYISQPILVFGNSIGEGNYSPMPQETIWFDNLTDIVLNSYSNISVSADADINIEAETNGIIPKGIKTVHVQIRGKAGSVTNAMRIGPSGFNEGRSLAIYVTVANAIHVLSGWVPCDSDGDISITRSVTFDQVRFRVYGVQLR